MSKDRILSKIGPSQDFRSVLEETLREGARQLLQQVLGSAVLPSKTSIAIGLPSVSQRRP